MRYIIDGQKKSAYFDNSKPWYLLGIVSFGTKTCGIGNPAIYTRWNFSGHFTHYHIVPQFSTTLRPIES